MPTINQLVREGRTSTVKKSTAPALNKGMINFKGNLLFTSHDQELMETVANRIIEINGTKTYDKLTTYDEYLEDKNNK